MKPSGVPSLTVPTGPSTTNSTPGPDVFAVFDRFEDGAFTGLIGRDDPFVPACRNLARFLPDNRLRIIAGFPDSALWRSVPPDQVRFFAESLVPT